MRNQDTTKHDYGHAMLVAGAYGRMGCAILAARAALRSGCGLVSTHLPALCVAPMQTAFPEAMVDIDPDDRLFTAAPTGLGRYTAIAAGEDTIECGLIEALLGGQPATFVYAEETGGGYGAAARFALDGGTRRVAILDPCADGRPISFDALAAFLSGASRDLCGRRLRLKDIP